MGVKIFNINPRHITVHDQYVECCCTEEEKMKLLTKLEEIHVALNPEIIGIMLKLIINFIHL